MENKTNLFGSKENLGVDKNINKVLDIVKNMSKVEVEKLGELLLPIFNKSENEEKRLQLEDSFEFDKSKGKIVKFKGREYQHSKGYKVTEHTLNIPETIDGVKVLVLGDSALKDAELININLPEGLVEIGAGAFSGNFIEEIVIPETVVKFGSYIFGSDKPYKLTIKNRSMETDGLYLFRNRVKCGTILIEVPENSTIGEYLKGIGCKFETKLF